MSINEVLALNLLKEFRDMFGSQRDNEHLPELSELLGRADAFLSSSATDDIRTFQDRVLPWMRACFGREISNDIQERNHRFIEESLELVQACNMTRAEVLLLVDYVFSRPIGEDTQEVGGVMVTLAALCLARGKDMHACGETELKRIWGKIAVIRAKQAAKPKRSVLP